ncbi:ferredoxin--NADP+ reductase [Ruminococcaceae bacterium FB2012]|nr:ferredoxin--NADP+ reductase [Ruminococcaceae bacterium FB2012]
MYKILKKRKLNEQVVLIVIDAPFIAAKAEPGQFVIVRCDSKGERIPFTISDYDREKGTVTVIYQIVGASTIRLNEFEEGDEILDVAGPLGVATEYKEGAKRVAVVGGGVGCAIAYPQAKKLHNMGVRVDMIAGFRNKELIILEDEMRAASEQLYICTDDGSFGFNGFVTDQLKALIEGGAEYDEVIAIGPVPMMKFVSAVTKPYGIKTLVSLNPIMVDGTGMCGCCRVKVGGKIRYACVEGPDFDGHEVDFDELMRRNSTYREHEKDHVCRLTGGVRNG